MTYFINNSVVIGLNGYPLGAVDAPPPFNADDVRPAPGQSDASYAGQIGLCGTRRDKQRFLRKYLKTHWKVSDIKDVVRQLRIDLQQEPEYSRMIFDGLLSHAGRTEASVEEALLFLSDPFLNTRGAGNYLAVAEHLTREETSPGGRQAFLGGINQALELGLIPCEEIYLIVKTLPGLKAEEKGITKPDRKSLLQCYRGMWDSIGRCTVFSHKDLDKHLVDAWLGELAKLSHQDFFLLARDIILAAHGPDSDETTWTSMFINGWLKLSVDFCPDVDLDFVNSLLAHFNPDVASQCIIHVTESLVCFTSDDQQNKLPLERWQDCLGRLPNISSIAQSRVWVDAEWLKALDANDGLDGTEAKLSASDRVLVRLWILRIFSSSLPGDPPWKRATDFPVFNLFEIHRTMYRKDTDGDFMTGLMKGIHDLNVPSNGLLTMAVDVVTRKYMSDKARTILHELESSDTSLADIFADVNAFNSTKAHLYTAFDRMIRGIDVTSPTFISHCLDLAAAGDSISLWTIIRIIRCHSPLKIALCRSWLPIAHASDMTLERYRPNPRTSEYPDPHAALEFINLLAIALSRAKNISPRRSYALVFWLYRFLMWHSAPIKPSFVRAIYHAGVTRYEREGRKVTRDRYNFILDLVDRFETPEVVKAFRNPYGAATLSEYRYGESYGDRHGGKYGDKSRGKYADKYADEHEDECNGQTWDEYADKYGSEYWEKYEDGY